MNCRDGEALQRMTPLMIQFWQIGCALTIASAISFSRDQQKRTNCSHCPLGETTRMASNNAPTLPVKLLVTEHKQFLEALQKLRGKRVLILFWSSFSAPDRKLLSGIVEIHKQRIRDLETLSLNLDQSNGVAGEVHRRALRCLRSAGATFA